MAALDYFAGSLTSADAAALSPPSATPRQPALALARRLHDTVVQRLAGLSLVLGGDQQLDELDRTRCRDEVLAALDELRDSLEEVLTGASGDAATFPEEHAAMSREHPRAAIDCTAVLPLLDEPLVDAFLAEGLRNARKHARPRIVHVTVAGDEEVTEITLRNDGVARDGSRRRGCGVGVRLLETEASVAGCLVDGGPGTQEGWWTLRLIMPSTS